jgi:hypothetical protein
MLLQQHKVQAGVAGTIPAGASTDVCLLLSALVYPRIEPAATQPR